MGDPLEIPENEAKTLVTKIRDTFDYLLEKAENPESPATYKILGLTRLLTAFTDYRAYKFDDAGEALQRFIDAMTEQGFSLAQLPDDYQIISDCACLAIYGTTDPELIKKDELRRATPQKPMRGRGNKLAAAKAEGAVTELGERLFAPSDPEFESALVTSAEGAGYFLRGPNGDVEATDVNPATLRWIGKTVYINCVRGEYTETRVYLPSILQELGIDARPRAKKDEKKIARIDAREQFVNDNIFSALENIWGRIPGDTEQYKLITIFSYDPESEILSFTSPFFQNLIIAMKEKEESLREAGNHSYLNLNDLVYATAASEQNQAAVEMMVTLTNGVLRRGTAPDANMKQNQKKHYKDNKVVTYRTSCASLIHKCPLVCARLRALDTNSKRTQYIKRVFNAMYRLLKTRSALYDYYLDVTVTEIIPTATTMEKTEIVIKHYGINPNYKRPKLELQ